jgi:putative membrane protein
MLAIMNTPLLVVSAIFVAIAAIFHVYIFTLESITWTKPRTWKIFGIPSQADADTIKPMALNQGFYNLFLAVEAGLGVILLAVSLPVAITLMIVGAGSMVLAALVLVISNRKALRSALIQGAPPLVGLLFLLLAAVAG